MTLAAFEGERSLTFGQPGTLLLRGPEIIAFSANEISASTLIENVTEVGIETPQHEFTTLGAL